MNKFRPVKFNFCSPLDGTTLNAKGKLREMSVEPFNMAADTLRNEVAVAPPPSKAKTEMKALIKKVTDTSETIIHKAATVIEHPVEFVKAHGNVDNMSSYVPPPVPPTAPVFESTASDYDTKTNYTNYHNGGSGFNTAAFTTTTTTVSNTSTTNSTNGPGGGLFGSTPQKNGDYNNQTRNGANGMSGNSNLNSVTNGQNRSPDLNNKFNGNNSTMITNTSSTISKGSNRPQQQQQQNIVVERLSPVLEPPQTESSKALAAEKWEAELQRVKNEKKWEAEVARIKQERRQEAEEQERRDAEEAINQENIRQGKLQPQPKHRKKHGEEGGPDVVGAGGCGPGCVVS
jgi:hypothetical protein